MSLTYSRSSGAIKRDGAVVGVVKEIDGRYVFKEARFNRPITCEAATVEELLPKIKKELTKR